MKPSLENQQAEFAAAENRPQINTVIPSTVPQKKIDINTSLRAVESYPSYPPVSATAEASEIPSPVDNSVDNPVDNVNVCELAAPEQVNTLYQQISDFARTHSIAEVQELPPVAEEGQWLSAHEDHPAEPVYADCWIPQRPRKDSRFDDRYAFDAFMQSDRQRHTCSRYSPSEYSYVKDLVKERICYDALCEQFGKDRVDTVVDILMEINSAVSGTFRVEGVEISVRDMKSHFAKVNQFHVERMFENLDKHYEPITRRKIGYMLKAFALGLDTSPVKPIEVSLPIKSVGNSTTPPHDIENMTDVKELVYLLAESVATRLRENNFKARCISVSARTTELVSSSCQTTLSQSTCLAKEIAETALRLFEQRYRFGFPFRSMGINCSQLSALDAPVQVDMFGEDERRVKQEQLERSIDGLRSRFGHQVIRRGIVLSDLSYSEINPKEEHIIHPVGFLR